MEKTVENKPNQHPQQPETKAVDKHVMGEICLFNSPSHSRGRACRAESQHKRFMKTIRHPHLRLLHHLHLLHHLLYIYTYIYIYIITIIINNNNIIYVCLTYIVFASLTHFPSTSST